MTRQTLPLAPRSFLPEAPAQGPAPAPVQAYALRPAQATAAQAQAQLQARAQAEAPAALAPYRQRDPSAPRHSRPGPYPPPRPPAAGVAAGGADAKTHRVRPYALTGGRTRSGHMLPVETFVATIDHPERDRPVPAAEGSGGGGQFVPESRAILELCRAVRSVAEVSALLRLPLGVVRILISDLADQGRIRVYGTGHGPGGPDRALLERVLSGLRRL